MGRGDHEVRIDRYRQAQATAPRDVSAELASAERQHRQQVAKAQAAREAGDKTAAASASILAEMHDRELAGLRVADAARREWREATAQSEAEARDSAKELRSRGLAERIPVTDTEVATAAAEPRETPPMDPAQWGRLKAEQTAQVEADRQARVEAAARQTPVTEAEVARYGRQEPEPEPESTAARTTAAESGEERSEALAGLREDIGELGAKVDELARQDAERAAERAEIAQAAIDEPSVQAERGLEPSWQPGSTQARYEAGADLEMGG